MIILAPHFSRPVIKTPDMPRMVFGTQNNPANESSHKKVVAWLNHKETSRPRADDIVKKSPDGIDFFPGWEDYNPSALPSRVPTPASLNLPDFPTIETHESAQPNSNPNKLRPIRTTSSSQPQIDPKTGKPYLLLQPNPHYLKNDAFKPRQEPVIPPEFSRHPRQPH